MTDENRLSVSNVIQHLAWSLDWKRRPFDSQYFQAVIDLLKERRDPVIHCKDCVKQYCGCCPFSELAGFKPEDDFYCKEGAKSWL